MHPFSGASQRIDLHLAQRIESVPERALCSRVVSSEGNNFLLLPLLSLSLFFQVCEQLMKGIV